jgi:hypothetical protein
VTTVDEYSSKRGLVPAIIDAACDRLRPVVLTTLTTVLGMLPLLFEGSRQAQFLKPTVVTLIFGLGFGMVLVLLLVPSLLVIQQDLARFLSSYRRGLFGARIPRWDRAVLAGATLASVGLLAGTFGYHLIAQGPAPWVVALAGSLAENAPMLATISVFVLGMAAVILCALAAAQVLHGRRDA